MTFNETGKHYTAVLQPGKRYLLRLANTGINNYVHVTLDGHLLEVIAADFIPIVPYTTTSVVMAVG
jgi:FtsP/CotA-like multicopper oxidase with cupredoxin domain